MSKKYANIIKIKKVEIKAIIILLFSVNTRGVEWKKLQEMLNAVLIVQGALLAIIYCSK